MGFRNFSIGLAVFLGIGYAIIYFICTIPEYLIFSSILLGAALISSTIIDCFEHYVKKDDNK